VLTTVQIINGTTCAEVKDEDAKPNLEKGQWNSRHLWIGSEIFNIIKAITMYLQIKQLMDDNIMKCFSS